MCHKFKNWRILSVRYLSADFVCLSVLPLSRPSISDGGCVLWAGNLRRKLEKPWVGFHGC